MNHLLKKWGVIFVLLSFIFLNGIRASHSHLLGDAGNINHTCHLCTLVSQSDKAMVSHQVSVSFLSRPDFVVSIPIHQKLSSLLITYFSSRAPPYIS